MVYFSCRSKTLSSATLAQLVERIFRKDKVPGSIPGGGSKKQKEGTDSQESVPDFL